MSVDRRELEPVPRKELHVFYILDISGSMAGERIGQLNHAMEECTAALTELAKKSADALLKIAVLTFSTGCNWLTINGPEKLEDFEWEYQEAGGLTDIGDALDELNSKLSRHEYLSAMTGAYMPVMIFMTDGYATQDYLKPLENIRENKWFKHGIKIGFALGDDADDAMIASVVGAKEAVVHTCDMEIFRRLMKFVTVTASKLVSQTQTKKTAVTGTEIVEEATKELDDKEKVIPDIPDDAYNPEPKPEPEPEPKGDWGAAEDW